MHPDREIRKRIVKDHLELLSPKQVGHIIALESYWNTDYGATEYREELKKLKKFLEEEP